MNNYFPHDSNSRNSDKLLPVRMKFGAEGYGIYFMILERLRDEKNYMSVKDYNMLAFDLRVDAGKVKSIVEDFGLFAFTENGECFYSEGFNKRMEIKDEKSKKRSEAGKKGAEKRWQKNSNAIAKPLANDSKESKGNESKGKKSKENTTESEQYSLQIYSYLEKNGFGSPYGNTMGDNINFWLKDLEEAGLTIEQADAWMIHGVNTAIENNNRRWKYLEGILKNRFNKRLFSKAAIEGEEEKRKNQQAKPLNSKYQNNVRREKLPDWVDKQQEEKAIDSNEKAEIDRRFEEYLKRKKESTPAQENSTSNYV